MHLKSFLDQLFKTSMCILKLDNQVTKLDQDLRFEINGTSPAEDFAMFSVHRVFLTSAL